MPQLVQGGLLVRCCVRKLEDYGKNEAELGEFYMVYGRSIEPEWGLKTNKHAVGAPHWE